MEFSYFKDLYIEYFAKNGLNCFISDEIIDKMYKMSEHMLEINSHMNLTAITEPGEIIAKHLVDCAAVSRFIPSGAKVCDIGCGAGFPSLPLAIVRPDLTILGIDSTEKRINYVNDSAKLIGLKNLSAIAGRAEDLARDNSLRESFDVCCARAVAALPILSELCIPFVKVGGKFVAMKGNLAEQEISKAPQLLGCEDITPTSVNKYSIITPSGEDGRCIVELRKISKTSDKYPRNYSQIKKKPL